jgi:uncharacterized protein YqgC (DUF456 family)
MLPWIETGFEILILVSLIVAWLATVVPIFPAPAVIWGLTLLYGLVTGFDVRGIIFFVLITLLTIAAVFTDEVLGLAGARKGGARWMSIVIASIVGFISSILLTPIAGILITVGTLFLVENYYKKDAEKAWQATKQMVIGWGWAIVARLAIGLVQILLWIAWAWF